ncbi:DNA repair protein RecO [Bacteroidales bacterium]
MSHHSRGIVLQQLRFGDSNLIVKIFTEEYGLMSFMVKGAFGKRSRIRPAFFQPLTFIEFECSLKINRDLQFMTEIGLEIPFQSLHHDAKKNAIVIYISELLSKTIVEASPNKTMFGFIHQAVQWLDLREQDFSNFHLYFMVELSRFLGFYPRTDTYAPDQIFDLMNGNFCLPHPSVFHAIEPCLSASFHRLCQLSPNNLGELHLLRDDRQQLLDHLITYYRLHLPGFQGMHSHQILSVVLG